MVSNYSSFSIYAPQLANALYFTYLICEHVIVGCFLGLGEIQQKCLKFLIYYSVSVSVLYLDTDEINHNNQPVMSEYHKMDTNEYPNIYLDATLGTERISEYI